jgi:hypothetical protein
LRSGRLLDVRFELLSLNCSATGGGLDRLTVLLDRRGGVRQVGLDVADVLLALLPSSAEVVRVFALPGGAGDNTGGRGLQLAKLGLELGKASS